MKALDIHARGCRLCIQSELNHSISGNHLLHKRSGFENNRVQICGDGVQRLAAREFEKTVNQVRAPFCSHDHRVKLSTGGKVMNNLSKQLGLAHDDGEQFIEIMRHASRHLPDGLKPLRLCRKSTTVALKARARTTKPRLFALRANIFLLSACAEID